MLSFIPNTAQKNALQGLAFWIADTAFIQERYGVNDPELIKNKKTITSLFNELDRLKVPFWVQNNIILFSENWRDYKKFGTDRVIKNMENYC